MDENDINVFDADEEYETIPEEPESDDRIIDNTDLEFTGNRICIRLHDDEKGLSYLKANETELCRKYPAVAAIQSDNKL